MILLQPVLEVRTRDGFDLWPVAGAQPYTFAPLSGALSSAEVGAAVMYIAACNDSDPEEDGRPPRPVDPLGAFLHGLLTVDTLFASGGLRAVDTASGVALVPGCCNGMDERRDWSAVFDDRGRASFGHDPSACAERFGSSVRLTVDAERDGGPVIEVSVAELRRLLASAERDLVDFLRLVGPWADGRLPDHAARVTAAVARALDVPGPASGDAS